MTPEPGSCGLSGLPTDSTFNRRSDDFGILEPFFGYSALNWATSNTVLGRRHPTREKDAHDLRKQAVGEGEHSSLAPHSGLSGNSGRQGSSFLQLAKNHDCRVPEIFDEVQED